MLVLASQSAARKALLQGASLRFESSPARIDERAIEGALMGKAPEAVADGLARAKALAVSAERPHDLIIGADQILSLDGTILHKTADMRQARAQLVALRGRTHALHSGVALARNSAILWSAVEVARLTMREFSGAELDAVLRAEGEAVLGSVGAYRLEGAAIHLFESIEGDYFTILGLPLLPLLAALRRLAPDQGFT